MTSPLASTTTAYADLVGLLRGVPECTTYAEPIAQAAMQVRPDDPRRFALLIAAVGQVETQWGRVHGFQGTTGPSIIGADGHGRGLMQVDDRYHALAGWDDPATNILSGARILDAGLRAFAPNLAAGCACYNCGPENVRRSLAEDASDPDRHTTGHDYSKRVASHYRRWSLLVIPDGNGGIT